MKTKNKFRWIAFLPPAILLAAAIVINMVNEDLLITVFTYLNNLFMTKLGWMASLLAVICFVLLLVVCVTPFGNVKLGGKDAKPTLSGFNWFCVTLTTTLASGILIWGFCEPVYHLADPASAITGIAPMTGEAAKFAMETMYMHWSLLAYAIYTIPAVAFGFMIFNAKQKYSVASQMSPLLGKANTPVVQQIIDAVLLFCIGVGMAACTGQGLVNLVGCSDALFGTGFSNSLLWIFGGVIGVLAIGTAITGIDKGIKLAARINVYGYIFIFAFLLFMGPTSYILGLFTESLGGYVTHIFERGLWTGTALGTNWPQSWTSFYWASWMSWAPTTGMFLATISYGRKIKEMIMMILGACSATAILMVSIMSGTAIHTQLNGIADVLGAMGENGLGAGPYAVIKTLPGNIILLAVLFVVIILTLITAVNGNIVAMAGMSHEVAQTDDGKDLTPWYTKLIWGVIVIAMAVIAMALMGGYDGIKTMSNIGGICAAFLMIGISASVAILIFKFKKFDKTDAEEAVDKVAAE